MARKIEKRIGNKYLLSHIKFLRKGDNFKTYFYDGTDVELTALSNPYFDPRAGEWTVDIENPDYGPARA